MRMLSVFGAVVLSGLLGLPAYATEKSDAVKADLAKLVGSYQIVAGERSGQKIAGERVQSVRVRIAADTFTTLDDKEKEIYVATYKLDTSHSPWQITMMATITPDKSKGTQAKGLIQRDGDTVKLIYALPGGKTPTSFNTEDKQQMFVLKRSTK